METTVEFSNCKDASNDSLLQKLHRRKAEGNESGKRRQVTQETLLKLMMGVMSMMSSIMSCDVEQYIRLGPTAIQREYGIG